MRHEHDGRKIGILPSPGEQEAGAADDLDFELAVSSRIGLAEVGVEEGEGSGVELGGALVRNRRKAQRLRKVKRRGLDVHLGDLDRLDRDCLRPKESGPHDEKREKERQREADEDHGFSHDNGEA
jgi:hypothetical protein